MTRFAETFLSGMKGRSVKQTLLFYLILLVPLIAASSVIAVFFGEQVAIDATPVMAAALMSTVYLLSFLQRQATGDVHCPPIIAEGKNVNLWPNFASASTFAVAMGPSRPSVVASRSMPVAS